MSRMEIARKAAPLLVLAALAGCGEDEAASGPRTTNDPATAADTAPPPVITAPPTNGTPPATMTMSPSNARTPAGNSDVAPGEATGSVAAPPASPSR
jgi:hypothetical protein